LDVEIIPKNYDKENKGQVYCSFRKKLVGDSERTKRWLKPKSVCGRLNFSSIEGRQKEKNS